MDQTTRAARDGYGDGDGLPACIGLVAREDDTEEALAMRLPDYPDRDG